MPWGTRHRPHSSDTIAGHVERLCPGVKPPKGIGSFKAWCAFMQKKKDARVRMGHDSSDPASCVACGATPAIWKVYNKEKKRHDGFCKRHKPGMRVAA